MAALARARERQQWGQLEELVATHIEVTWELVRVMHSAWGKKGAQRPAPLRIPRPGAPQVAVVRPAELARMMAGR